VELENPTNKTIVYDITIDGDYLSGDDQLVLEPGQSGKYTLIYSPLKVGGSKGYL
jgi:hypothetical protein